jgi:hypothetical protein
MEFVGDHTVIYINRRGSEIIYNCKRIPVTKKLIFNENEAKLETVEYIIKYSKGELYLYHRKSHQVISVFKFNCFKTVTLNKELNPRPVDTGPPTDTPGDTGALLIGSFIYSKNTFIDLFLDETITPPLYYLTIISSSSGSRRENVVSSVRVGSSTEYTTERGNILSVSTKRQSTWNGVPIGLR